ncbi:MAG: hypothetical protein Q7J77_03400 [Undibacterium sp.]|nr:hypothetical protein [Undibacterium sp.]
MVGVMLSDGFYSPASDQGYARQQVADRKWGVRAMNSSHILLLQGGRGEGVLASWLAAAIRIAKINASFFRAFRLCSCLSCSKSCCFFKYRETNQHLEHEKHEKEHERNKKYVVNIFHFLKCELLAGQACRAVSAIAGRVRWLPMRHI